MKLEFSLTSKVNPVAEMKLGVDCTADELAIILSDPVYRDLGKTLIAKLSQVQVNRSNRDNRPDRKQSDHAERRQQHVDQANHHKVEELRKLREVVEAQSRAQDQKIETLQSLIMRLCRKVDEHR